MIDGSNIGMLVLSFSSARSRARVPAFEPAKMGLGVGMCISQAPCSTVVFVVR
jgi:hypothetical protein